jgi:hypothetical protein
MPDTLNPDPYDDRTADEVTVERVEAWVREAVVPTIAHPLRTALLLLVVGLSSACAPFPINALGVAAVVLLILDRRVGR